MNIKRFLTSLVLTGFVVANYGADPQQAVNDLIPKLAVEKVADRYAAQMELQALASQSSRPGQEAERAALAKILAAKVTDVSVPQPARVWMVRQLEYMAKGEAVAALTQLMDGADAELRECARRALEKNPDPAALASLRGALGKSGDAAWKTGLINALGERRDPSAVPLIAPYTGRADTLAPAIMALGKIADKTAVDELWRLFPGQPVLVAQALTEAANRLVGDRQTAPAKAVYQKLYVAKIPAQQRAAVLAGLAKADPKETTPLVVLALTGNEPRLQSAAITAAPAVFGRRCSQELAVLLPKLATPAKLQVLGLLDASAEKEVIEAAGSPEEIVRVAALEALGRMGGAASVAVLLKAASDNTPAIKTTAQTALGSIRGRGALAELEKAAAQGDPASRAAAMAALTAHKDRAALAALLKYAGESDLTVSQAALSALGKLGADAEVEPVAKMALVQKNAAARGALKALASRVTDKDAATKKLTGLAAGDKESQLALLEAMSAIGGKEALAQVAKYSENREAEVQDSAIRSLSNWPDFGAAQTLLQIASNPATKDVHQVLALRGLASLVAATESESGAVRTETTLAALKVAKRLEDKKFLLAALGTVTHAKAAAALKTLLADPELKNDAGLAGINLATKLLKTEKAAAKDLAKAVKAADLSVDLSKKADAILKK